MEVAIVGSKDWDDYNTVIRTMTVVLEDWKYMYPDDNKIVFWHTGADGAERMVAEWVGKVERLAKQKNHYIKDKVVYAPVHSSLEALANLKVDMAVVFSTPYCKRSAAYINMVSLDGIEIRHIKA